MPMGKDKKAFFCVQIRGEKKKIFGVFKTLQILPYFMMKKLALK